MVKITQDGENVIKEKTKFHILSEIFQIAQPEECERYDEFV